MCIDGSCGTVTPLPVLAVALVSFDYRKDNETKHFETSLLTTQEGIENEEALNTALLSLCEHLEIEPDTLVNNTVHVDALLIPPPEGLQEEILAQDGLVATTIN